jgi:hypothetical protein
MFSPSTVACPGGWPGGVTPDESALDYIYGAELTNFSNVNMTAIAIFLNLWFEKDAARVEPIRKYMETRWWAPDGVPQAASRIGQPYFEAIHALTTESGVTEARMDEVAALLEEFELLPYTSAMRVNCDEAELDAGSCLALDGTTTLTLNPKLNRSDSPIALAPLRPGIRSPSNFDARSDPFEVNGGDESGLGLNPGGDLNAAYWMLRWAPERAAGTILTRSMKRRRVTSGRQRPTPAAPVPGTWPRGIRTARTWAPESQTWGRPPRRQPTTAAAARGGRGRELGPVVSSWPSSRSYGGAQVGGVRKPPAKIRPNRIILACIILSTILGTWSSSTEPLS